MIDLDSERSEGSQKISKRRIRVTQKRRTWSNVIPENEALSDDDQDSVISGMSGTVTIVKEKKISDKSDTLSSTKKKQPFQPTETNLPVQVPVEAQTSQTQENAAKENTPSTSSGVEPTSAEIETEKETTPRKHVSGFDQGLVPEEIVGATDINGFKFLLKWKDYPKMEFIEREVANKKIPQLVIAFYEARVHFDHDQVSLDSPFHPLAVRNLPNPLPE